MLELKEKGNKARPRTITRSACSRPVLSPLTSSTVAFTCDLQNNIHINTPAPPISLSLSLSLSLSVSLSLYIHIDMRCICMYIYVYICIYYI